MIGVMNIKTITIFIRRHWIITLLVALLVFTFLLPPVMVFTTALKSKKLASKIVNKIFYSTLMDEIIKGQDKRDKLQIIRKVNEFINFNVQSQDLLGRTRDIYNAEYRALKHKQWLVSGYTLCTYYDEILINLLSGVGLKGRIAVLKSGDPGDGHDLAEIFLDGKWVIVDPSYALLYAHQKTGELYSVKELDELIRDNPTNVRLLTNIYYQNWQQHYVPVENRLTKKNYFKQELVKYYSIPTPNSRLYSEGDRARAKGLHRIEIFTIEMIELICGNFFVWNQKFLPVYRDLFFDIYFRLKFDQKRYFEQYQVAKFWYFLGNHKRASAVFRKLIRDEHQTEEYYYDARLWSVMNLYKLGRKKEADQNFDSLIKEAGLVIATFIDDSSRRVRQEKLFRERMEVIRAYTLSSPEVESKYKDILARRIGRIW